MPVVRAHCVEDDHAAPRRRYPLTAARHLLVPELELTSPFRLPFTIQVHDHIDATLQLQCRLQRLVGVDLEKATMSGLMQPAVVAVRITDQTLDTREPFEERQERRCLH